MRAPLTALTAFRTPGPFTGAVATAYRSNATLTTTVATAIAVLSACARPSRDADLVSLQHRADTLWLMPAPGVRISAGYTPRLELVSGAEIRFGTPSVSPDSLWFTEPPMALAPQPPAQLSGTLKASTCDNDAGYCRLIVLPVRNGRIR